jgi:seryl-tRNA synthetase
MIDINLLRIDKGGDPQKVRDSQAKRNASVELVDRTIALDNAWIKASFDANQAKKDINAVAKQMAPLAKAKMLQDLQFLSLKSQKDDLETKCKLLQDQAQKLEAERDAALRQIGNIVHESCVVDNNEANNLVVDTWWPAGKSIDQFNRAERAGKPGLYSHHELLEKIGGYDPVRGTKVAGHRGYFLTGPAVDLNLALIQYGLNFLEQRGYTKLYTPFFMEKQMMAKTAQLSEFDEALYKLQGENGDDMYLIATSEQPISAFHQGEWFSEAAEFPIKYAGVSTCFRKEAGAHGRDTWGIFRVHQFEKIEQFVLTEPSKSWEMHEEMLQASKEFYQSVYLTNPAQPSISCCFDSLGCIEQCRCQKV